MLNKIRKLFAPSPKLEIDLKPVVPIKKKSRNKTDRVNQNWNKTPERCFFKCLLGVLIRKGLPKGELIARFQYLVPDYQMFFDHPVSDNAVWGRADTGRRGGKYRNENPDVHSLTSPYWPLAQMVVEDDKPLTADQVREFVAMVTVPPAEVAKVESEIPAPDMVVVDVAKVESQVSAPQCLPDNAEWTNQFQIKSQSSTRIYIVAQRISDGSWGCSCPGWKANRRCKHLQTLQPTLEGSAKRGNHHSFSDAAYEHYDASVSGYGSPDDWERIAAALFGSASVNDPDEVYLSRLDLAAIPPSLAELTAAFRRTMFRTHPDYGGTNLAARETMEAYAILKSKFTAR